MNTRDALAESLRLQADEFDAQRKLIEDARGKIEQAMRLFSEAKDVLIKVNDSSARTHALLVETANSLGTEVRRAHHRIDGLVRLQ